MINNPPDTGTGFRYWKKAIGAVLVTVATGIVGFLTDDRMDATEWMLTVGLLAGTILTAVVPNFPPGSGAMEWLKTISMFIAAAATVASVLIVGGLTLAELLEVLIAGALAVGVVAVPTNWGDFRATGHIPR